MKKILLCIAFAVACLGVDAKIIKIDVDGNGVTWSADTHSEMKAGFTTTVQGVTISFYKDESSSDLVAPTDLLKLYKNSTMIVDAGSETMNTIVFKCSSGSYTKDLTPSEGSVTVDADAKTSTWTGSASSVNLTASEGQLRISDIEIYTGSDSPTIVDISNTPETAYTVSKALEIIAAGEGLDTKVYVKGTVSEIEDIDTDKYGNASYYISDGSKTLYIYRGFGLENKKFNEDGTKMFEEGDDVIVYGKLTDYVKDDVHTPEMAANNFIYSLNGETENNPGAEPYVPTGDGSLANPYTADDVKGLLGDNNAPAGSVWVKGTIVGTANSGTKLNSEADKEESKTNIALGSADVWVPVQLKTDSAPYNNINIVDNPDNLGKDVWVYGTVEAYFTVAGVKNVTNWSFDGVTTTINAVSATTVDAAAYNLAGQRVNNNYKGAVIKNGKKFMVK